MNRSNDVVVVVVVWVLVCAASAIPVSTSSPERRRTPYAKRNDCFAERGDGFTFDDSVFTWQQGLVDQGYRAVLHIVLPFDGSHGGVWDSVRVKSD
jgi:hypothetical protein